MRGKDRATLALGMVVGLLGLAGAGAVYEWLGGRRDRQRYLPLGTLVDIGGGRRLHLRAMGAGGPTVVLEAGLAGFSLDWGLVQPAVAKFTRVISYDRAGYGWSDPGPAPRTAEPLARELHTLLQRADVPGPYVLVGHSFGGFILRMFAHLYPDETLGMVLVDTTHEDMVTRVPPENLRALQALDRVVRYSLRSVGVVGRLGPVRIAGNRGALRMLYPFTKLPEPERAMAFAYRYPVSFYQTAHLEYRDFLTNGAQVRKTGSLGAKPVIVLTALGSDRDDRPPRQTRRDLTGEGIFGTMASFGSALHADLTARLSTQSAHIITRASGHQIPLTQPALVVDAIREVIARATSSQPPEGYHRP